MNVFYQRSQSAASSAVRILALIVVLFSFMMTPVRAAHDEAAPTSATHVEAAGQPEKEHHGLPAAAPTFGDRSKGAWVNSSMIVTWIVAALIIGFAQYATRRIRSTTTAALEAPTGAQNFWEFLVEGLRDFLEEIIGRDLAKKTFWFFATAFIVILFTNWFGLLPGVGTIGMGHVDPVHGFVVETPLLRGGNADLNMTFAMSAIFFVMWTIWAIQFNGFGGFVKHLFGAKGGATGAMGAFLAVIFLMVGVLEVISIVFRPVSLSFRLYGNIFAGENLLESMQEVYRPLGFLTPIPFYFMELLVGLVQALVFMLLTAVFTLLICSHDEEHGEHHGEHAKEGDGH